MSQCECIPQWSAKYFCMIKGQCRKRSGDEPCSIVTVIYSISSRCKKEEKKKQANKNNSDNEMMVIDMHHVDMLV